MFQLTGRIASLALLQDGHAMLRLRRESAGLLGPEIKVLVPPLVLIRDGEPLPGQCVELGAQSMAETGMARREPDCLLVARYIWPSSGGEPQTPESGVESFTTARRGVGGGSS